MKKEKLNIILPEKKGIQVGDILSDSFDYAQVLRVFKSGTVQVRRLAPVKRPSFYLSERETNDFKKLNRHAIIKPSRGKKKGFYFNLVGDNFEIVGTSEVYTTKAKARKTLKKYFPSFRIQTPDK